MVYFNYQFQSKYPGLSARLTQKTIASYSGITAEYFSQIMKKELFPKS